MTAVFASHAAEAEEISAEERQFFEGKVRPIFEASCLRCHSEAEGKQKGGLLLDRKAGWLEGGDSGGAVLNLEAPEESLLLKMVQHDPDFEAMPPKEKLSDDEIETLVTWVKMGAPDPRSEPLGVPLEKEDFDLEKRRKWWSLQPLKKTAVPDVSDEAWPRTGIDRFILAKLEEKDWKPAGPAEKSTLLRRASFALTGLAPTVAELEAFLADGQPDAYERQIDRLLASEHFGERFARYWMDVVRYADSKAFEQDYTLPYGHEYRDYLIRAFNNDVPFDQFVREAFAGDLLEKPRIENGLNESLIGPGFLLATDGQHGPPDLHEDEARIFDGMINTASVAFQGLTVSCAKCHDHKFDAITTADYYSMYGILRSSRLNYASIPALDQTHREVVTEMAQLKQEVARSLISSATVEAESIEKAIALLNEPAVQELLPEARKGGEVLNKLRKMAGDPMVANWLEFLGLEKSIPELNGLRQALISKGPKFEGPPVENTARFEWQTEGEGFEKVRGAAWIVDGKSDRLILAGASDGFVAGSKTARLDGKLRSRDFVLDGKPVVIWARGRAVTVNLIVRNYELTGYGPTTASLRVELDTDQLTRVQFNTDLWVGEPAYLEILHQGPQMKCVPANTGMGNPRDDAYVHVPERFDPGSWNELWTNTTPSGVVEKVRQLVESPAQFPELVAAMIANGLVSVAPGPDVVGRINALQESIPRPRFVRSLTDGHVYDQPVFIRGNHRAPSREDNPKHFLDAFGGLRIGENGSGRLEFAEHLVTTSKALTARVRVNRIWSRIFGRGLVASVDDFGKMGELPSHPELLEYLAQRFVDEGWSTKKLIREMMLSSTYRMSSRPAPEAGEVDPKNALLQHMPIQRLDAESIRDHILNVSGNLKREMFGPVIPGTINDLPPARGMPQNGPIDGLGRRTIYLEVRRNFLSSFLRAFNLPIPGAPVGKRQVTTVPVQSLTLMNSEFVHHQAGIWAGNLAGTDEEKIRQMHLRAFSRPPDEGEVAWAKNALAELGADPWPELCHLMFNRKEFLYVF